MTSDGTAWPALQAWESLPRPPAEIAADLRRDAVGAIRQLSESDLVGIEAWLLAGGDPNPDLLLEMVRMERDRRRRLAREGAQAR